MRASKRKFWIYYNSQRLTNDFTVEEFGYHDSVAGYAFEETRINNIIHFVCKGICRLTLWDSQGKEEQYAVGDGEAFVVRAGVRHKYVSDLEQPCARYWVSVAGEHAEDMLLRCGITPQTVVLKNIPQQELHKHFRKYYQYIPEVGDIAFQLYSVTYGIFGMLKRIGAVAGDFEKRLTDKQVLIDTIVRYVENNLALKLETKEIARKFGYERSYLYRLFKKEKGVSLQQYISDSRIKQARYLLTETEHSCVQIATMVGYESYAAFFKVFKEKAGQTPDNYRRSSRRDARRTSSKKIK